jgi:EthD domain
MVKLVFLCRRRPDITHEHYTRMLLGDHAPLALAHHQTMWRYVVNIVEESLGGSPPLDSIGELFFQTLADFQERLYDSPEGERLVARDVARFMGGADAFATREHGLRAPLSPQRLGERSPGTKLLLCLRRRSDASPEKFVPDWLASHAAPLLERGIVQACVANIVEERLGRDVPDYDGIVELWLPGNAIAVLQDLCVPSVGACYRVAEYVQRW